MPDRSSRLLDRLEPMLRKIVFKVGDLPKNLLDEGLRIGRESQGIQSSLHLQRKR